MTQVILSAEFGEAMYRPEDWAEDPETLLSNLRVLMNLRSAVITDNAFTKLNEYSCTVHRDWSFLMGRLFSRVQDTRNELRSITTLHSLPDFTNELEQLARLIEAIQLGSDNATDVYETHRLLDEQIRVMEKFCIHWKRTNRVIPKSLPPPLGERGMSHSVPVEEACQLLEKLCSELSLLPDMDAIQRAKGHAIDLFGVMGEHPARIVASNGDGLTTILLQRMYGALPWWREVFSQTPMESEWPWINPDQVELLNQHGQLIHECAFPVTIKERTIIPAELTTAMWTVSRVIENLLGNAIHPDPDPLRPEWYTEFKDAVRSAAHSALRSVEADGENLPLDSKIKRAERLSVELITLLANKPHLSTIPVEKWTIPHYQNLFNELKELQVEFEKLGSVEPKPTGAAPPDDPLVTAMDVAQFLNIERTSLNCPKWPNPDEQGAGRRPNKWLRSRLVPFLEVKYPAKDWSDFPL